MDDEKPESTDYMVINKNKLFLCVKLMREIRTAISERDKDNVYLRHKLQVEMQTLNKLLHLNCKLDEWVDKLTERKENLITKNVLAKEIKYSPLRKNCLLE